MTQSDFTGSVSDVLQKAARFYENGDLAAAARFCDAILKAAPGHADTLHLRGIVAFKSGHGDEAVALIRRAIAANGDEPSYYNSLGGVLIDRGAYAEAVEALRKSVALAPAYPQALFNLGTACFGLGAAAEAEDHLCRGLALMPDFPQAHAALGLMAFEKGDDGAAVAALRRAALAGPRYAYGNVCYLGAEYAARSDPETLPGLFDALPPVTGDLPAADRPGMVIMTACDHRYFSEYGVALALSAAKNAPGCDFHFHVMNPDSSFDDEFAALRARINGAKITASRETAPGADRLYFSNIRFARLHQIITACERDILCLDTDSLIMGGLEGLEDVPGDMAIQLRPDRAEIAQQVLASTVCFRDGPATRQFIARLAAYILSCHRDGGLAWYLDQCAFHLVRRMTERAGEPLSVAALPGEFADANFDPKSPIWAAKGDRKLDLAFARAARKLTGAKTAKRPSSRRPRRARRR